MFGGKAVELGRRYDIATPVNETVLRIVQVLEKGRAYACGRSHVCGRPGRRRYGIAPTAAPVRQRFVAWSYWNVYWMV